MMSKKEKSKEKEKQLLNNFLDTKIGNNWYFAKKVIDKLGHESPDFLLKTQDNKTLGVEITEFYVEHMSLNFSRTLTRIGNQICHETKNKYQILISILIDRYDPRKLSCKWNDRLNASLNPGFSTLPPQNIFKEKLRQLIDDNIEDIKNNKLIKPCIQIDSDYYRIAIVTLPSISSGKYDCHVNNAGKVKFNPCEELQLCINKKNEKVQQYKTQCDECYLLVTIPSNRIGNYCSFTDEISNYKFKSNFKAIFLYDEDEDCSYILNS